TNRFKIIRMGADIRIKCENCQRSIMIPRQTFDLIHLYNLGRR
ncbi:DUF951 family protein, partial [Staphylococcus aureus]